MKTNTTGNKSTKTSTTIIIPKLKQESNKKSVNNKQCEIFKSLSQENLLVPDSNDSIKKWLLVQHEPNKRVKFATNFNNDDEKNSQVNVDEINSLPDINANVNRTHSKVRHSFQSENSELNELHDNNENHVATIIKPILYRSSISKTLSVSTVISSSAIADVNGSSVLPVMPTTYHRSSSIDHSACTISSAAVKYPLLSLSLLDFNASLSDRDRKIFEDIREQVPDEFEQLLPTLFKLGIVLWPKQLFGQKEHLTAKEMRLGQSFISIMEKDKQDSDRQRSLQSLYGSILPLDDHLHKHHLLRESLSFQGQLCLLETYRDEIEKLLRKNIQNWMSVPTKSSQTSFMDETNSIIRSSITLNTPLAKTKLFQTISSQKNRSNTNLNPPTMHDDLFASLLPNKIDSQWKRKLLAKIIEQGMDILDQVRILIETKSLNQYDDNDLKGQEIARKYNRWLYLCSSLYLEEK